MKNRESSWFAPKDPEKDKEIIEGLIKGDVEEVGGDYVVSMSPEQIQSMREEALGDKIGEEEEKEIEKAKEEDRKKFGVGTSKDEWEKLEEGDSSDDWNKK